MKYKLSRSLGLKVPPDGFTREEKLLEDLIASHTMQSIYSSLPTMRMKFIVAAHFELGYSQQLIAEVLGVRQPSLVEEIELIKLVLTGYKYTPRKNRDDIKPEHVIQFLTTANGV